mmetsp:Transcript_68165/g.197612  ORF Transcript_68165/g.197612 Transcript_68165/m.197612 type:complete len:275 (+) Transcript_68165:1695-2519(+)
MALALLPVHARGSVPHLDELLTDCRLGDSVGGVMRPLQDVLDVQQRGGRRRLGVCHLRWQGNGRRHVRRLLCPHRDPLRADLPELEIDEVPRRQGFHAVDAAVPREPQSVLRRSVADSQIQLRSARRRSDRWVSHRHQLRLQRRADKKRQDRAGRYHNLGMCRVRVLHRLDTDESGAVSHARLVWGARVHVHVRAGVQQAMRRRRLEVRAVRLQRRGVSDEAHELAGLGAEGRDRRRLVAVPGERALLHRPVVRLHRWSRERQGFEHDLHDGVH